MPMELIVVSGLAQPMSKFLYDVDQQTVGTILIKLAILINSPAAND